MEPHKPNKSLTTCYRIVLTERDVVEDVMSGFLALGTKLVDTEMNDIKYGCDYAITDHNERATQMVDGVERKSMPLSYIPNIVDNALMNKKSFIEDLDTFINVIVYHPKTNGSFTRQKLVPTSEKKS